MPSISGSEQHLSPFKNFQKFPFETTCWTRTIFIIPLIITYKSSTVHIKNVDPFQSSKLIKISLFNVCITINFFYI